MKKKTFNIKSTGFLFGIVLLLCFSVIMVKAVDEMVSEPVTGGIKPIGENEAVVTSDNGNSQESTGTCASFNDKTAESFAKRYGINIDYNEETNKIVISMDKSSADTNVRGDLDKVKFAISSVQLTIIDGSPMTSNTNNNAQIVSIYLNGASNELTLGNSLNVNNLSLNSYSSYVFILSPVGFYDSLVDEKCGQNSSFYIKLNYEYGGGEIFSDESDADAGIVSHTPQTTTSFTCNNYKNRFAVNSLDYKFCEAKASVVAANVKKYVFEPNKTYHGVYNTDGGHPVTFKCDAFNALNADVAALVSNSSNYQYINKSYLWGESSQTKTVGEYVYNYGGQDPKTHAGRYIERVPITCDVTCTEIVKVEYGLPIATSAGLCFEYNVKATSYVKCDLTRPPDPPAQKKGYCTPTPKCVHSWAGANEYAGGPNYDFDACVSQCDGGKYSDKCVDQCYNKVYEQDPMSVAAGMVSLSDNIVAKKTVATYENDTIQRDEDNDYVGYYRWDSDLKHIIWSPANTYGRFYKFHPNVIGYHDCTKTADQGGGIATDCGCSAVCSWTGCEQNNRHLYLNPGEAANDNKHNNGVYEKAKKACSQAVTCRTTTAVFTMDVNLKDYNVSGNDAVVHFPFDKKSDKYGERISVSETSNKISCVNNSAGKYANSALISSDGCYLCNNEVSKNQQDYYLAEWGFSGTWISHKTGEISYEPVDDDWTKLKGKFCTPFDMKEVNEDWWLYYFNAKYGSNSSFAFNDEEYLSRVTSCKDGKNLNSLADLTIPEKQNINIEYNITGKSREFGLFNWDIDVSCFYGYMRLDKTCAGAEPKKVKSVHLNNLFPASDGTPLTSPSESGASPGLNWSYHALNVIKDPDFKSNPYDYMVFVQTLGYNVYAIRYLDYQVLLTRKDIKEIQENPQNYTSFNDGKYIVDSVVNYQSPLFRGANAMFSEDKGNKFPKGDALKCNNMKNYNSNECEDFSGVGGLGD